jgi:hypothetical protein|tara:strand:+ start:143 stop:472 length:330 start_codon:yes stop_codon:yes gene_type:complete
LNESHEWEYFPTDFYKIGQPLIQINMKNVFFALAFMLVGTFAFANNAKKLNTVNLEEAVELIESSSSYELVEKESLVDCLLTITFIFEDGSSTTRTVLVRGVSCAEILE